jgi:hypothetical protein
MNRRERDHNYSRRSVVAARAASARRCCHRGNAWGRCARSVFTADCISARRRMATTLGVLAAVLAPRVGVRVIRDGTRPSDTALPCRPPAKRGALPADPFGGSTVAKFAVRRARERRLRTTPRKRRSPQRRVPDPACVVGSVQATTWPSPGRGGGGSSGPLRGLHGAVPQCAVRRARPAAIEERRVHGARPASGFDQKGIRRPAPIGIASESQLVPAASRADALACSIRPAPSRCGVGSAGTSSVPGRELAGACGDSRSRRRPRGARSPSAPDGRRSGRHLGRLRLARRPVDDAAQLGTAGRTDQARLRLIVLERIAVLHGGCGRLDRRPRSARAIRRGRWSVGIWRKRSGEVPDHVDAPRYGRRPGCTGRG